MGQALTASGAMIWRFHQSVDASRVRKLLSYANFEAVASLLEQAQVDDFAWEPFRENSLHGCHRACFLLSVSETSYDAFFNSPVGYRAQYAISAAHGDMANRALLQRLEPHLLAYAKSHSSIESALITASLRATQSKLWIAEAEVPMQLGSLEPAIAYAPWEAASESGVGLLAPVGTQLQIMGGWLTPHGEERLFSGKSDRSDEIHRTGFS